MICNKCGLDLSLDRFEKMKYGIRHTCKKCRNKSRYITLKNNNPEFSHERWEELKLNEEKHDCRNRSRRIRNRKLKFEVLTAYGGKCEMCGEKRMACLTIDHSFGDGNVHRKSLSGDNYRSCSNKMYSWLKNNNFPKNLGLRVLCWNCNCAKGDFDDVD